MKKKKLKLFWPFILAGVLFLAAIFLITPYGQQTAAKFFQPENAAPSSYNGFEAFIPYTMGYFPEGFMIASAGNSSIAGDSFDQYQEWYSSEEIFIILQQTKRIGEFMIPSGEALTIQEQPAVLVEGPELGSLTSGLLDFEAYDTSESYQIVVVLEEIKIEVITNLPRAEAVLVAENLIPSQCLNKPTETP